MPNISQKMLENVQNLNMYFPSYCPGDLVTIGETERFSLYSGDPLMSRIERSYKFYQFSNF